MSFESRATALRAEIEFWIAVGEELLPVPCSLHYQAEQPFEFTATFHAGDTDVTWLLSRELVAAGLTQPAGDGDVRISPALLGSRQPGLVFELRSEQGSAALTTELAAISGFLDQTFGVVPLDAGYPWPDSEDLVTLIQPDWQSQDSADTGVPSRCRPRQAQCRQRTVARASRVRPARPDPRAGARRATW